MKESEYDPEKLGNKRNQQNVSNKTLQFSLLTVNIQGHQKPLVNAINIPPACFESASYDSAIPQSPASIITPTIPLISDIDLIKCTRHIHGNVSHLAGYLGIKSTTLDKIEHDYREAETQAYWVLKKWQETTSSNAHRTNLHDLLQASGFYEAAERYLWLLH